MKPAASVLVLTYNHEAYLDGALEGLRRQRTNFSCEVVVADDCSQDETPAVARRWANRFDGPCRLLSRPKNLGVAANFVDALAECRGRRVAILEGDDYWTDAKKLQKQWDFLHARRDHSACFHCVRLLLDDGRMRDWAPLEGAKPSLEFTDVLVQNFVPNCSTLMFNNEPPLELPAWLSALPYYDWTLHACNAERGKLGYLKEAMSVYRVRAGGSWHGKPMSQQVAEVVRTLDCLDRRYEGRYAQLIRAHKRIWQQQLTIHLLQEALRRAGGAAPDGDGAADGVSRRLKAAIRRAGRKIAAIAGLRTFPFAGDAARGPRDAAA